MKRALLAGVLAISTLCNAQEKTVDPKAAQLIQLYLMTCVAHQANWDALKTTMARRGFPLAANPKPFLMEGDGIVWSTPASGGHFVVALNANGVCSVFGAEIKGPDAQELFSEALENIAHGPSDTISKTTDKAMSGAQESGRYIAYVLTRAGTTQKLMFALSSQAGSTDGPAMATFAVVTN